MSGILTDEHRTARKPHACTLCFREIPKGMRHRFYTYAGEGTVWTHREHFPCADLFYGEWWDGNDDDYPDPGELFAALAERGIDPTVLPDDVAAQIGGAS